MQSELFSFIGAAPAAEQMARLGIVLAIIGEHSFYLWDRVRTRGPKPLISAIDAYRSSTKHTAIALAVDKIFKEDEGRLLEEAKASEHPGNSAFATQLVQITLNNRLSPP